MLNNYQKQKLFYSLIEKSKSFNDLKKNYLEIVKIAYNLNISNITNEEKEFIKNNKSLVNSLKSINLYEIKENNSYKKNGLNIKNNFYFNINYEYRNLVKDLKDDKNINNIIFICDSYSELPIHKILGIDDSIIIPDITKKMNDVKYLLELDKNGIFDFKEWINLLNNTIIIREKLRDRIKYLEEFLNLEFLNITELKSISPELLYKLLKDK